MVTGTDLGQAREMGSAWGPVSAWGMVSAWRESGVESFL
jgi:hypothetical protein